MLWADPSNNISCFGKGFRGQSITYGTYAAFDFLSNNGLSAIIRGHEKVNAIKEDFQGKCITIYSTSVPTQGPDQIGYYYIDENFGIHKRARAALPFITYEDANFFMALRPRNRPLLPLISMTSKKIIKPNILTSKKEQPLSRMKRGGSLYQFQTISLI